MNNKGYKTQKIRHSNRRELLKDLKIYAKETDRSISRFLIESVIRKKASIEEIATWLETYMHKQQS